jgi:hypothetical protein
MISRLPTKLLKLSKLIKLKRLNFSRELMMQELRETNLLN